MIDEATIQALSGPSRVKRLSSLESILQSGLINNDIIEVLLAIENEQVTLERNRELHLERLLKLISSHEIECSQQAHVIVIRSLLGTLYINFEKFWKPTLDVISEIISHSKFSAKLLKEILDNLKETNDIIYGDVKLEELSVDRPDHVKHREHLLQLLKKSVPNDKTNQTLLLEEFFRFVQKEILVSPFIERFNRDNLTKELDEATLTKDLESNHEVIEDHLEVATRGKRFRSNNKKKSINTGATIQVANSKRALLLTVGILQSFLGPKIVPRQDELKQLLLDLLCCRDSDVQKISFTCLVALGDKRLEFYSPKFLKLFKDEMIKTELTLLSSSDAGEAEYILNEDRPEVVPVLLRILFGKMLGKIGKKSSGKDKAALRKEKIIGYMSDCSEIEIKYFFDLLFEPIMGFIDVPYNDLERALATRCDLSNYIPLNKLQAMLISLSTYMEKVANTREPTLPHILKLINIIVYLVIAPLENQRSQLSQKSIDFLRQLKRNCLATISQFFNLFPYYKFQQNEIDFIFKYLIWNSTQEFIDRNYATQTPLFSFIALLAENKVFHKLLVMRNKENQDEYLLRLIVDLFTSKKTERKIMQSVSTVFANLLKPDRHLSDDDGDNELTQKVQNSTSELAMLGVDGAVIPDYDRELYKVRDLELTFGEKIIIGFIPVILQRLQETCQKFIDSKKTDYHMSDDELLVLSVLCEYLRDSEQSLIAVRLLLMTLSNLRRSKFVIETLKTVQSLLRQVKSHSDPVIIPLIANFLGYQVDHDQRQEVCKIIDIISQSDERFAKVSESLQLMNSSYDGSSDQVKCFEGVQVAINHIESLDPISADQIGCFEESITILTYQIGFMINNPDKYENSIRKECVVFYEKLAEKLSLTDTERDSTFVSQFLGETLLNKFIKKGLREKNELVKHSYIEILRALALNCSKKNKILSELHEFCDENNQDLDFWKNIKHIQIHNRSRALARLIASEKLNQVSPTTLSSYLLPIASSFLFAEAYKSVANLAENSIKLIGIICKRLNWVTYKSVLTYYLDRLTEANSKHQRKNIQLVTEIIKNFNFDLTACKDANEHHEEDSKLEERMKKRTRDNSEVIAAKAPIGKRLNPSSARMVYNDVTKSVIPGLYKILHESTSVELEHDKNIQLDKKTIDMEKKRIPLAYAIVQLLNLLPCRYILFRDKLPGLFEKLSSFLKSKHEQTRSVARATLVKIMNFIGPAYMPDLLRVLKLNLVKGFQIHVLHYTIHSVLEKLPLHYGSLDTSAHELVQSCFDEIFGRGAEDKEVAGILEKTMEARKTKSYDTLLILSTYISAEKLPPLMSSIKEKTKTSSDAKIVSKLSRCVEKIFTGLAKNNQFPLTDLLTFIQLNIQEFIPSLNMRQKAENSSHQNHSNSSKPIREDRFLIVKDTPRGRMYSKINEKSNLHLIVDNCLRLLLHTFENNQIVIRSKNLHQEKLDGLISLLSTCLKSSSPRCIMRSLKCIHYIAQAKIDLPSFRTKSNSIVKKIFILLSLYNGVGMAKGDNFEMIGMCFKTLNLLLLKCKYVNLDENQVRALMSYIEQDLSDSMRQATAFGTLHSLLSKKYESPELPDIMAKVANLLVTSENESVRHLSIKAWHIYFMEYKHESNNFQAYLTKFLRQLEYEYIDGRTAVLKMLRIVVSKFPETFLRNNFDLMFHLLAQRVVNEESQDLRKNVGQLIGLLLQRLPFDIQVDAFKRYVVKWASEDVPEIKLLGVKLISIFVESCPNVLTKDKQKMKKTLKIITSSLEFDALKQNHTPTVRPDDEVEQAGSIENQDLVAEVELIVSTSEKLVYHSLRLFQRLLDKNLIIPTEDAHIENLKKIWTSISSRQLCHKYTPVVLTSCELYMTFIKETDIAESLKLEHMPSSTRSSLGDKYLDWNASRIIRAVFDKCIDLLDRVSESDQLLDYLTSIIVTLGQIVANSYSTREFEKEYLNTFEKNDIISYMLNLKDLPSDGFVHDHLPYQLAEAKKRVNLMWMSIKVTLQARKEAALYRLAENYRRDLVLKWIAAVSQTLGSRRIAPYTFLFVMAPIRELTDKGQGKSIDSSSPQYTTNLLAEDLLKFIRNLIGDPKRFNDIYSKVQLHYTRKRVDRKKNEAILKIVNQQRGVKRKVNKQKQKSTKRRKNEVLLRRKDDIRGVKRGSKGKTEKSFKRKKKN